MLTYKSAYKWEDGVCLGQVLDFPGTVAAGDSLPSARKNLAAIKPQWRARHQLARKLSGGGMIHKPNGWAAGRLEDRRVIAGNTSSVCTCYS